MATLKIHNIQTLVSCFFIIKDIKRNVIMTLNFSKSSELISRACRVIPEGVSSPGRKFSEVEAPALFIERAEGACIYDADGNEYIDFVNGLGPIIMGHAHPEVTKAIAEQAKKGAVYGISNKHEIGLAEKIVSESPGIDKIRFVCSGTEATMSALRLAKKHTGRSKVLKFRGSYHGHGDCVLGSSIKSSELHIEGVDKQIHKNTLLCDYNDIEGLVEVVTGSAQDIAALIIEPFSSNMGLVRPDITFIKKARELCSSHNIVLIFDEVVTGFRLCYGSVAKILGVIPDVVVYGKIIGGGTPIGAYGASEEIMKGVQAEDFFQGGTFSSNPITMAAGNVTLDLLKSPDVYRYLEALSKSLCDQLNDFFEKNNLGYHADYEGSLVSILLCKGMKKMKNLADNQLLDRELFSDLYSYLLEEGIMLAPTIDEPLFISYAHKDEHINKLVAAVSNYFIKNKI